MKYIKPYHLFESLDIDRGEVYDKAVKEMTPYLDYIKDCWNIDNKGFTSKDMYVKNDDGDSHNIRCNLEEKFGIIEVKMYMQNGAFLVIEIGANATSIDGEPITDGEKRMYMIKKLIEYEYNNSEKGIMKLLNETSNRDIRAVLIVCYDVYRGNIVRKNNINCGFILENQFLSSILEYKTSFDELLQYSFYYCKEDVLKEWWINNHSKVEALNYMKLLSESPICGERFKQIIGSDGNAIKMSNKGFAD